MSSQTEMIPAPSESPSAGEVHIVDADPGVAELLMELLENQFQVKTFSALSEFQKSFLDPVPNSRPDLVLCDAKLQDTQGLETLRFVRKADPAIPVILMVHQPEVSWIRDAFSAGATDLLEKPFESFLFIDKFAGRIVQSRMARKQLRMLELLERLSVLTTTYANRLIDHAPRPELKKLRYPALNEDGIAFRHAGKNEEKLLKELEQCRIEYLALAQSLESP